jgi:mRNA-degrading endonuclease toxin of MazEF toxin-antitoxin module
MWEEFLNWIKLKFKIQQNTYRTLFKEGEVWWANLGQNIGDEENGKGVNYMRPAIVIKKYNRNLCLIVPTSSQIKENKYYFKIKYNGQYYSALVSQLRTVDSKRFRKKIAELPKKELADLKQYILLQTF